MHTQLNRSLAAALSATLILSSTPLPALAQETVVQPELTTPLADGHELESQAVAEATIGGTSYATVQDAIDAAGTTASTVVLASSVSLSAPIQIGPDQSITLDLAGKSVVTTATIPRAVVNRGTLIITNSTGTGAITASRGIDNVGGTLTITAGAFIFSEVAVENRSSQIEGAGSPGTVTVRGGTFTSTTSDAVCVRNTEGGSVTLAGGVFNASNGRGIVSTGTLTVPSSSGLSVSTAEPALKIDGGTATVDGGTFVSSGSAAVLAPNSAVVPGASRAQVTITGGRFTGAFDKAVVLGTSGAPSTDSTLTISGGTFNGAVVNGGNANPADAPFFGKVSSFMITGGTYSDSNGNKLTGSALTDMAKLVPESYVMLYDSSISTKTTKVIPNSVISAVSLRSGASTAWSPTFNGTPQTPNGTAQTPDLKYSSFAWSGTYAGKASKTGDNANMTFAHNTNAGKVVITFADAASSPTLEATKMEHDIKRQPVDAVVPTLSTATSTPYHVGGIRPGIGSGLPSGISASDYDVTYNVAGGSAEVPVGSTANVTGATVTFKNNYSGSKNVSGSKSYTVIAEDIAPHVLAIQASAPYTGNDLMPEVWAYDAGTRLIADTHYTVDLGDTTTVTGSPITATIKGKASGGYNNSATGNFTVEQRDLSDVEISYDATKAWPYGTTPAEVAEGLAFKAGGKELALTADDYDVELSYPENGKMRATVVGKAPNCYGAQSILFDTDADLSDATVTVTPDAIPFAGTAVTPTSITVKIGDTTVDPSDYSVTYAENDKPGKALVTISPYGTSNVLSGVAFANFDVVGDLNLATVTVAPPSYGYMGVGIVPKLDVKIGTFEVPETAYKVSATGNTAITASAQFSVAPAAGQPYMGSRTGTFSIVQRNIADSSTTLVELEGGNKQARAADGTVPQPEVILTDVPTGTKLSLSSSDIQTTYAGLQSDGTYQVQVEGKAPNCTGKVSLNFTLSSDFSDATIEVGDMEFVGDPVAPTANDVKVKIGSTEIDPSKYSYTITKNSEPGVGGIIVTPKENTGYTGVKVGSFNIVGNLDKAVLTLDRTTYAPDAEGKVDPVTTVKLGNYVVPSAAYEKRVEVNAQAGAGVVTVVPAQNAPYRGGKAASFLVSDTPSTPISPVSPVTPVSPVSPQTPATPVTPVVPSELDTKPALGELPVRAGDTATGTVTQDATGAYVVSLTDNSGKPADGWVTAGGDTYFAVNGTAVTGKKQIDDQTFYFGTHDAKLRTGFVVDPATGTRVYAIEAPGVPAGTVLGQVWTGGWIDVSGARYYSDASGALRTGWLTESNGLHHYLFTDSDGEPTGTLAIGRWFYVRDTDGWYYADSNGAIVSGWFDEPGTGLRYALNDDSTKEGEFGKMRTGWYWNRHDGCWYYLFQASDTNVTGSLARNGWLLVGGQWYLTSWSGTLLDGWQFVNGGWYHLCTLHEGLWGAMETGWVWDGTGWYYCNASGVMQAGWIEDAAGRYYLSRGDYGPVGRMVTGWVWDGVCWFYFGAGGRMLRSTWTPDGYYVDATGRYVA